MKVLLRDYDLWKLKVPTGRVIGDCTCRYEHLDLLVIRLQTNEGHSAWGFGETVSDGVFSTPAPWIRRMPSLAEIRYNFERNVWPILRDKNPFQLSNQQPQPFPGYSYLALAIRIALWDLMAQVANLPLYEILGGGPDKKRVRAYASGLDCPLSDEEAAALFRSFVSRGFTAVKVKVGKPDAEQDLKRLQLVREVVGKDVEIAIDANEAWDCDEAIRRVSFFQKEGIHLAYVEDLLPATDLEGTARLNASIEPDVIGHDYLTEPKELRRFVERKAFSRLRVNGDLDYARACADLALEFGTPLVFGNSMFELNVHPALALPKVDRMEFSDLAWNLMPITPVRFEAGYGLAPEGPGHGLAPNPEFLLEWNHPEESPKR
jgi:L-alanine-DL-glutamate epimerase-like enolase superfamily enzyme